MTEDFNSSSNSCGDVMCNVHIHVSLSVLSEAVTKAGFDSIISFSVTVQRNLDYDQYTDSSNLCWE